MTIRFVKDRGDLLQPRESGSPARQVRPIDVATQRADAGRNSWLADLLAPLGVRRRIRAQECLFNLGHRAGHYYLVESGRLVLHRHPRSRRPSVRTVEDGDLFIYDCGGIHAACCHALIDTYVLAIDRRGVEIRAMLDPALKGVLQAVHASELGMILDSLGVVYASPAIETHDRRTDVAITGQRVPRGRWLPHLAHEVRSA